MDWTADDQGIYMADLVAGELTILHKEIQITTFTADAESLLHALVLYFMIGWLMNTT